MSLILLFLVCVNIDRREKGSKMFMSALFKRNICFNGYINILLMVLMLKYLYFMFICVCLFK